MTMPLFPQERQALLMIMDGHAMVHRSFRAISQQRNLTSSTTGEDTTGVYGLRQRLPASLAGMEPGLLRHRLRHLGPHLPARTVRGTTRPSARRRPRNCARSSTG